MTQRDPDGNNDQNGGGQAKHVYLFALRFQYSAAAMCQDRADKHDEYPPGRLQDIGNHHTVNHF